MIALTNNLLKSLKVFLFRIHMKEMIILELHKAPNHILERNMFQVLQCMISEKPEEGLEGCNQYKQ